MKKNVYLSFGICTFNQFGFASRHILRRSEKPKLNMKKLNMTVGSTFSLRVYNAKKKQKITFTSSKPSVAISKT